MMRVLTGILQTLLGIVVALLSPLRRAICRRRKNSASDISVPIQGVGDMHSTSIDMTQFQVAPPMQPEPEMTSWDAWGSEESSVSHGNHARMPEPEPEPEPDYFRDMVPEFQRAKKIKVRRKEEGAVSQAAISSRLAVQSSLPPQMSGELTAWEDDDQDANAWELEEEGLVDEAEAAVRNKRRQERQQRNQQRRRQEKMRQHAAPHLAAVKLS